MFEVTLFLVLVLFTAEAIVELLIRGIPLAIRRQTGKMVGPQRVRRFQGTSIRLCLLLAVTVGWVAYTQAAAHTPAIRDAQGKVLEGSLAKLECLELNGRKQWISIRARDKNNPVLLFLAGGPGGSQMAAVRHDLTALEEHFVVVGWDQPGAAKSYSATKLGNLTVETYIQDGLALTAWLRETFVQEKILLVGESWGSALGVFLVDRAPEAYHALVGTGQMVDFDETERLDYRKAMELAEAARDAKTIQTLRKNGEPPYYGDDMTMKSAVYLNYLGAAMASNPNIHNPGYNTFRDLFSEEYGLLDKINYVRGILNTCNRVYPQLYGVDLRLDHPRLQVPIYFFNGRHDLNAPVELMASYAEMLEAPFKEIVWFEHSGHNPWINESERFVRELLQRVPR